LSLSICVIVSLTRYQTLRGRSGEDGIVVIDVRDTDFNSAGGHIRNAINITSNHFDSDTQSTFIEGS